MSVVMEFGEESG